jgi:hypothetical protein
MLFFASFEPLSLCGEMKSAVYARVQYKIRGLNDYQTVDKK